jgi:hypothetical protein
MFEHLQERRLCPLEIVEHENERLFASEPLE